MMLFIKKSYIDNRGSAIITGLVVSAVLMVMCLSLLLISYSLFVSTTNEDYDLTNREMLYSAAEALELELMDAGIEGQIDKEGNVTSSIDNVTNKAFAKYIYDNIVNSEHWASGIENKKYFNMTGLDRESEQVVVEMYWEKPDADTKNGAILHATYCLYDYYSGDMLVKTDRKYRLDYNLTTETISGSGTGSGGNGTSVEYNEDKIIPVPGVEYPFYGNNGVKVVFKNESSHNSTITVVNDSPNAIESWKFYIYSKDNITSNDPAYCTKIDDSGIYSVQNLNWNGHIESGQASNAIYFNNVFTYVPRIIVIEESMNPLNSADYSAVFSDGKFIITNTSNKTIKGWNLSFDSNGDITYISDSKQPFKRDGNHYIVENADWVYKEIKPGVTIELTVNMNNPQNGTPTNIILSTFSQNALDNPEEETNITTFSLNWTRIGQSHLQ